MFFQNRLARLILMKIYQCKVGFQTTNYENNIFINSIPKSGTHLITNLLSSHQEIINSGRHIKKFEVNKLSNDEFNNNRFELDTIAFNRIVRNINNGQIITSHLPWSADFDFVTSELNKTKFLFFVRDPRDIFISEFFYIKNLKRHFQHSAFMSLANDNARFEALLYGKKLSKSIRFRPFSERIIEYKNWYENKTIHTLRYELLADQCSDFNTQYHCLLKLFRFLDLKFDPSIFKLMKESQTSKTSYTFRKGGSGGWKEYLDCQQQEKLLENLKFCCDELGYEAEI